MGTFRSRSRSKVVGLPPMYTWPPRVKKLVLAVTFVAVIIMYLLLGSGLLAVLALLADLISLIN